MTISCKQFRIRHSMFREILASSVMCIPTRRDANIRDVNGNIRFHTRSEVFALTVYHKVLLCLHIGNASGLT